MVAVKNVVTNYLKKLPTKHLILQQDNSFLQNMYEMLNNISEPRMVVACASWVASRMPPGMFFLLIQSVPRQFYLAPGA